MKENEKLNQTSLNAKVRVRNRFFLSHLCFQDSYNQSTRQYETKIAELRRQKERVEEKMMNYYKEPSPPKKPKGFLSKLKESVSRKSDSKSKRKSDYVSHVPVKSDAESENSFHRTHSDWSRASSQSIETRDRSGTTSGGATTGQEDENDAHDLKLDDLDISKDSQTPKSSDCISLQQFLDETNQLTPKSTKLATSYSHNDTLNKSQSDDRSVR